MCVVFRYDAFSIQAISLFHVLNNVFKKTCHIFSFKSYLFLTNVGHGIELLWIFYLCNSLIYTCILKGAILGLAKSLPFPLPLLGVAHQQLLGTG